MSLNGDAIVWVFNGHDGAAEALVRLVGVMVEQFGGLLPEGSDDPFERIAAEFSDDPTSRMLDNPRLRRMFPPALPDQEDAQRFWRDSIGAQARARLDAAATLVRACHGADGWVLVRLDETDDWVKTLSGLRLFWHAELAGPQRLAQAPEDDDSGLADLVDWLGYLIEDLIQTRAACLAEGRGLSLG